MAEILWQNITNLKSIDATDKLYEFMYSNLLDYICKGFRNKANIHY